jgi:hypothetical protein
MEDVAGRIVWAGGTAPTARFRHHQRVHYHPAKVRRCAAELVGRGLFAFDRNCSRLRLHHFSTGSNSHPHHFHFTTWIVTWQLLPSATAHACVFTCAETHAHHTYAHTRTDTTTNHTRLFTNKHPLRLPYTPSRTRICTWQPNQKHQAYIYTQPCTHACHPHWSTLPLFFAELHRGTFSNGQDTTDQKCR